VALAARNQRGNHFPQRRSCDRLLSEMVASTFCEFHGQQRKQTSTLSSPSFYRQIQAAWCHGWTLDSVGTILCYHTSNTILLNATLLLVYFFIMSKSLNFMSLFCVHVYVLYELFFVHNVVYLKATQPCIPPGSLNRVPASAGVKAGMSPLPGGR